MIGEDKTQGTFFHNINAYSSTNLVEWTWEGALLTRGTDGDLGPERIVERPKVVYNAHTDTYVMYMHIDNVDYSEARVGVATCKTVVGSYEYKGSFRPLDCESRDIGLFKDDDGSAYLLAEDVCLKSPNDRPRLTFCREPMASELWLYQMIIAASSLTFTAGRSVSSLQRFGKTMGITTCSALISLGGIVTIM